MSQPSSRQREKKNENLRVTMFAPTRRRCGISDYSRLLITALNALPGITVSRTVEPPEDAVAGGSKEALKRYAAEERRFQTLGTLLNGDLEGEFTDVAHLQHQYFFFGGVAPYKSHIRAFLNAVRVPLVMTVHEIAKAGSPASFLKQAAVRLANRRNFLHSAIDRLIVHTGQDRDRLKAIGVLESQIQVIPHGIPSAEPMPDPETAKRALGLEGRRVVTLFGFLSAKKGHRLALEAIRKLPSDVLLLFAGDRHPDDHTDYVANLLAEVESEELANRVQVTGYLPEERIPIVMAATDVAIAPFLETSGSGSLANLLAYARPIVASDIAPHREITADSPACLALFESGNGQSLAASLRRLLEAAPFRTQLQSSAQSYADRHSYAQMAFETVKVYEVVCRR